MIRGPLRVVFLASLVAAGCTGTSSAPSVPAIRLDTTDARQAVVEVVGLSPADLSALVRLGLTDDEWSALLRVSTQSGAGANPPGPAVAGRYSIDRAVRFAPSFPLDAGREYDVSFDPTRLGRAGALRMAPVRATVSLPRIERSSTTVVTAVYPSGGVIPVNQLRMYVEFSGPMGQQGGLDHIVLLDEGGLEIADALLPLDTQLWNPDRTRYTLLLDPGRVKREILPNRRMGRPLREGETITLVVKASWLDAHSVPLQSEFRQRYRVGRADEQPLDTSDWRITSPAAGTRDPLRVTFPKALDRALLQRALTASRAGAVLAGEAGIEGAESVWTFVPREPWQAAAHALLISPILEDGAGNRIGRAFEVRSPGDATPAEDGRTVSLPFSVGAGSPR